MGNGKMGMCDAEVSDPPRRIERVKTPTRLITVQIDSNLEDSSAGGGLNSQGPPLIAPGYNGAPVMFRLQTTEPRSPARLPALAQLIVRPVTLTAPKGH